MKQTLQPLTISISKQNLYIAAGLGVLVLVLLTLISSMKTKNRTQSAIQSDELAP
jgi:hypothetical protein